MWFGVMLLWMLAFWVGVVVLGVWVAGLLFPRVPAASQSAREILDARLARGELTRAQFQELLAEFSSDTRRDDKRMHVLAIAGGALILLALLGMGGFGGWGMHGPGSSGMPHMQWRSGVSTAPGGAPVAGAQTISVDLLDSGFRPAEIRLKAGQVVNLDLVNRSSVSHDFTVFAWRVQVVVQPGQRRTVGLRAPAAGVYEFYCSEPGHREAGMVGLVIITP